MTDTVCIIIIIIIIDGGKMPNLARWWATGLLYRTPASSRYLSFSCQQISWYCGIPPPSGIAASSHGPSPIPISVKQVISDSRVKSSQVKSSQVKSSQVNSSQVKCSQCGYETAWRSFEPSLLFPSQPFAGSGDELT